MNSQKALAYIVSFHGKVISRNWRFYDKEGICYEEIIVEKEGILDWEVWGNNIWKAGIFKLGGQERNSVKNYKIGLLEIKKDD